MHQLSTHYKTELAEKLTVTAIENGLFSQFSDSEDTAKEICKFFQYIIDNVDQSE